MIVDYLLYIEEPLLFYLMLDYLKANADIFAICEDSSGEKSTNNYFEKYNENPDDFKAKFIEKMKPFEIEKVNGWEDYERDMEERKRFYKCSGPSIKTLINLKPFGTFLDIPFDIAFFVNRECVLHDVVHEGDIFISYNFWKRFFKEHNQYLGCLYPLSSIR